MELLLTNFSNGIQPTTLIQLLDLEKHLVLLGSLHPPLPRVATNCQSPALGHIKLIIQQLLKWIHLADTHDAKFGLHSEGLLLFAEVRVSMPVVS